MSVDEQDTVPSSRFRDFCRALGLSLFYHKLFHRARGNAPPEPTKVAIYGDRTRAMLSSLIHFVPVGVAISISSLHLSGVYIGGELAGATGQDQEKLAGLLFAAKLHELTITASLAAILFFYIRHEIVLETGVPFGATFAGLSIPKCELILVAGILGYCECQVPHSPQTAPVIGHHSVHFTWCFGWSVEC